MGRLPPPSENEIKNTCKHVAWEYVSLLGSALEMTANLRTPVNHFVQEAFLTHARNLAAFFRDGEKGSCPTAPPDRPKDDIFAVDFCAGVGGTLLWDPKPFAGDKSLIKAINKTLSHLTYSRDSASASHPHFKGHQHLHGTVKLISRTSGDFLKSVKSEFQRPKHPEDIPFWLDKHTENWPVKFKDMESKFESAVHDHVRESAVRLSRFEQVDFVWVLNETPDGPII